eukprot:TRINITY_DN9243_c0_g1_i1.p1 TRINITY_DN9243_c0_g1~~TRINITY_DN9243_c0_g1_i1.p1  ORF type:complete len:104 (-),score=38.43 TRINITY_DN9243_c0_g1_i1:52-363(-)
MAPAEDESSDVKLVFRNYAPIGDELKEFVVEPPKQSDIVAEVTRKLAQVMTQEFESQQDIINLAPKKPNWDLKRDVGRKLERVDVRTQQALIKLIQEKVDAEA